MAANKSVTSRDVFGAVAVLAVIVGVLVFGYGLLLVPQSVLGGVWIAAIGLSLVLSGLFGTEQAGDRFDLSPVARRRLSLAFVVLAVVLLAASVVVNGATFEAEEIESST